MRWLLWTAISLCARRRVRVLLGAATNVRALNKFLSIATCISFNGRMVSVIDIGKQRGFANKRFSMKITSRRRTRRPSQNSTIGGDNGEHSIPNPRNIAVEAAVSKCRHEQLPFAVPFINALWGRLGCSAACHFILLVFTSDESRLSVWYGDCYSLMAAENRRSFTNDRHPAPCLYEHTRPKLNGLTVYLFMNVTLIRAQQQQENSKPYVTKCMLRRLGLPPTEQTPHSLSRCRTMDTREGLLRGCSCWCGRAVSASSGPKGGGPVKPL